MKDLQINVNHKVNKVSIPETDKFIFIVDDFLDSLAPVLKFSYDVAYFNPMFADGSFFPGMRDHMPTPYIRMLQEFFEQKILPQINSEASTANFHKSFLSLVTCKPENLTVEQKMPHVDSCNRNNYAFVHYISSANNGGTSIYKYLPQQLIEFNESDQATLEKMRQDVEQKIDEHCGYIDGSTSVFERVLKIPHVQNRLLIYPGNLLHSANIGSDCVLTANPRAGRLAISTFASIATT